VPDVACGWFPGVARQQDGRLRLGSAARLPPSAEQVRSPYDPDARYSHKRDTSRGGYKVQVTETCDPACEGPHVITNVETTPATVPDDNAVAVILGSLEKRGLLPGDHLVDKGHTASHALVDSQQRCGATTIGPVHHRPGPPPARSPATRAGRRAWTTG